jgi:hypothetical protein
MGRDVNNEMFVIARSAKRAAAIQLDGHGVPQARELTMAMSGLIGRRQSWDARTNLRGAQTLCTLKFRQCDLS